MAKGLVTPRPSVFLQALWACGALAVIAPEVEALYGIPQPAEHHPEIDTGAHVEQVLDQAALLAPGQLGVAFAALVHDLGKGVTARDQWPKHTDHERLGVALVDTLCDRWKVPTAHRQLGRDVCAFHLHAHRAMEMRPGSLLDLLERVGAVRQPARLEPFLLACMADARGRLGFEQRPYPQADYLRAVQAAALTVTAAPYVAAGKAGEAVGAAMRVGRLEAIQAVRNAEQPGCKPKGP